MPLVLLKKAMADRLLGDCVRIDVTDIHAELDFEIWCERFGHKLVKTKVVGDTLTFEVTAGAV